MEPVWLRRSLANLAYVLPWPSLRNFKKSVDTIHPVCARVFYEKQEAFNKGGIAALANTASDGRDLTTLLSESHFSSETIMELLTIATSSVQANLEVEETDRMSDKVIIANMRFISRSHLWICSDDLAQYHGSGRSGNDFWCYFSISGSDDFGSEPPDVVA